MLTVTINKDGKAQAFTMPAALEAAIGKVITEPGSVFQSEADYLISALRDQLAPQVLRRYPPAAAAAAAQRAAALRSQAEQLEKTADSAILAVGADPSLATPSAGAAK